MSPDGPRVGRGDPAPAAWRTVYADRWVDVAPHLDGAAACHVLAHELGQIAADHATRRDVARGLREAEADGIAHPLRPRPG